MAIYREGLRPAAHLTPPIREGQVIVATGCQIHRVGSDPEVREQQWPRQPDSRHLREVLDPIFGPGCWEHVWIYPFDDDPEERHSMFVGEHSQSEGAPINIVATRFYRANTLRSAPHHNADSLPAVYGTAVIFNRRVWF